jgi:hypothetical protein
MGTAGAKKILDKHPETDAFVCATDTIAADALSELHAHGKSTFGRLCPHNTGNSCLGHAHGDHERNQLYGQCEHDYAGYQQRMVAHSWAYQCLRLGKPTNSP